ncbi:MAG: molybdopterin-dependent oxidoreductase, partial [Burkholderiales bacterium]|nr:molybdopterin-dependent oxidoreductase [Burkholderiales bacterium]
IEFVGKIQVNDETAMPVKTAFAILKETASKYDPKTVSEITGINVEDFLELAKEFYRLKGVVDDGWYSARNGNDSTAYALISVLNLMNGTFDRKGGLVVTQGGGFSGVHCNNSGNKGSGPHGEKWTLPDGKRLETLYYPEGLGTISAIYNAIEIGDPYPVRALFVTGSTMFHREAHTQSMIEALKATELVVVQDIFPPEIVDYADYVLPSTYFLEKQDYAGVKWNRDGWVQINDGVLQPPPGNDSRDERWQFCEILRRAYPERARERLGYDHEIKDYREFKNWWQGLVNDEWNKFIHKKNEAKPGDGDRIRKEVAEQGFALSALKKYETTPYKVPFSTPTGKAELGSFYIAEKYEKPLINPIFDYTKAPAWTYPKPNSYEFFLVSGKDASASSGTTLFTQPAEFLGDRTIWMNPVDAKRLKLMDGDTIRVTSIDTRVSGEAKLKVTNRVIPGSLYSNSFQGDVQTKHLCAVKGFDWIREGINTNRLCTAYKEPLVGGSCNNVTVMVELARRRMA